MDTNQLQKLRLDHSADPTHGGIPRRGKRPWLVIFIVLLLAGGGAYFWQQEKIAQPQATRKAAVPTETPTQQPAPTAASGNFTAAGYLEAIPPFPITVSTLVSGRVDQFDVLEGTAVQAGEVLAKLNPALQQKRMAEVEADLAVNEAKLAQIEQVLARSEKLATIGSMPAKELERAKAEAAIARAERQRLQAALDLAKWQLENTEVRAPAAGVVFERLAQVGEYVLPDAADRKGAAIVTLYDPEKIQAWVDVTQRDAARVKIGQRAEISLDAEPGKTYAGRVVRIQPRASLQKNTVQVKVTIENPSPMLRPDMSAKVNFFPADNQ